MPSTPSSKKLGTRALVLSLKSIGKTTTKVYEILYLAKSTINKIYARAIKRGFNLNLRPIKINNKYITDAPRASRPRK